ncbi:MAG: hypothetical protein JXQ91_09200 [Vannielia sp.]|uniref:hypothetical protein n=1 Tax=Vannielia sp. TaxID=2813045 RepID=UPI003B8E5006
MQRISFQVSNATLSELMDEARGDDISVGDLLRDAVRRELRRRHPSSNMSRRPDDQQIARLAERVGPAFAEAESWDRLVTSLEGLGYELRPSGGGLVVCEAPGGQRLCSASELGYAYARLIHRFGGPFPGHSHRHLVERVLGTEAHAQDGSEALPEPRGATGSLLQPRA